MEFKVLILAATPVTILIALGGIFLYTGNLMPTGEQASNMISSGKSLITWGIVLFLIELLVWFVWRCIDSGTFDRRY